VYPHAIPPADIIFDLKVRVSATNDIRLSALMMTIMANINYVSIDISAEHFYILSKKIKHFKTERIFI